MSVANQQGNVELSGESRETTSETTSLTTISNIEELVSIDETPGRRVVSASEDQTPLQMFTREYQIAIWNFTSTPGDHPVQLDVMSLLFSHQNLYNIASMFMGFRYKSIKIRLQMNANFQQYGAVMVACQPFLMPSEVGAVEYITTLAQVSQLKECALVSVGSTEAVEIEFPYIYPSEYIPFRTPPFTSVKCVAGLMSLRAWNIFGIQTIGNSVPQTADMQIYASFVEPELVFPCKQTSWTGPMVGDVQLQMMGSGLDRRNRGPNTWVGKGLALASSAVVGYASGKMGDLTIEVAKDIYSKPVNDTGSIPEMGVQTDTFGNLASGDYQADCKYLGYESRAAQYTDPCDFGDEQVRHSIKDIIKTPNIFLTEVLSNTGTTAFEITVSPTGIARSYLAYMSQFFRYWRGSIKFKFNIITSPMITGKLQFNVQHAPDYTDDSPSFSTVLGDYLSEVITFKGDTEYECTVPYYHLKPFQACGNVTDPLRSPDGEEGITDIVALGCTLQSIVVQGGSVAPQVLIVVSAAADDDFEFYAPAFRIGTYVAPPEVELQSFQGDFTRSPSRIFPGMRAPSHITMIDKMPKDIESLMCRYSNIDPIHLQPTGNVCFPFGYADDSIETNINAGQWANLAKLFLFWSGSMRFKFTFSGGSDAAVFGVQMATPNSFTQSVRPDNCAAGAALIQSDFWRTVCFEVPYYSTTRMQLTNCFTSLKFIRLSELTLMNTLTVPFEFYPLDSGTVFESVLQAVGSNFQVARLMPLNDPANWFSASTTPPLASKNARKSGQENTLVVPDLLQRAALHSSLRNALAHYAAEKTRGK